MDNKKKNSALDNSQTRKS